MQTALGFRTHSGWAALVAIGLSAQEPIVCDRRVIVLADPEIPGSKQPYHAAEPMPIAKAKLFLKQCTDSTYKLAVAAMAAVRTELKRNGHEVVACGMLTASGRPVGTIEAVLASHAAIHNAEGELYREAIAHACGRCKFSLTKLREKAAMDVAEERLGLRVKHIEGQISALGRTVGAPWAHDQKLAALAAWIAVSEAAARQTKAAVNH